MAGRIAQPRRWRGAARSMLIISTFMPGCVDGLAATLAAPPIPALGTALQQAVQQRECLSPRQWSTVANQLRDVACDLADEGTTDAQARHDAAQRLCSDLLETIKTAEPDLYAVAKLAAKRNGRSLQSDRRACERCVAELGLLVGTYASLEVGDERRALLDALRPVSQTVRTSTRLRTLLVLSRGYGTPGASPTASGWRRGKGTVQQLLAERARAPPAEQPATGTGGVGLPADAAAALDEWLAAAPDELRPHSRQLRAALALIDPPLQLWLHSLGAEGEAALASSVGAGAGASPPRLAAFELLVTLVETGDVEGVRLAAAVGEWAVDALLESLARPGADGAPSASVLARAHGSEAATLLLLTHGALVKGASRTQRRWLGAVERTGHAVWLMRTAAREARAEARSAELSLIHI